LAQVEERRDLSDEEKQRRLDEAALEALRSHFRPEFINRLDETVVFRRLGRVEIRSIVDVQLRRLVTRLAARQLGFEVTLAAKDAIAEVGFDPQFGARPLKRAIQRLIENPLAEAVLSGKYPPGSTVRVDAVDGRIGFSQLPTDNVVPPSITKHHAQA
jgi:ATP-dependent Clp protease ATP-binding subunit ClpB